MRATEFLAEEFKVVKVDNEFRLKGPDGKIGDQTFKNRALAQQAAQRATTELSSQANKSPEVDDKVDNDNKYKRNSKSIWKGFGNFVGGGLSRSLAGIILTGLAPMIDFSRWKTNLVSYVRGSYKVPGTQASPCERMPNYEPKNDKNIDPTLLNMKNETSFGMLLYFLIQGWSVALIAGAGATAIGLVRLSKLLKNILLVFPAGGFVGWIAALLVTTAAEFAIAHILKRQDKFANFIAEPVARFMLKFITKEEIASWCELKDPGFGDLVDLYVPVISRSTLESANPDADSVMQTDNFSNIDFNDLNNLCKEMYYDIKKDVQANRPDLMYIFDKIEKS
jgi:hypothetical protein